jgi:hypothetical protein
MHGLSVRARVSDKVHVADKRGPKTLCGRQISLVDMNKVVWDKNAR